MRESAAPGQTADDRNEAAELDMSETGDIRTREPGPSRGRRRRARWAQQSQRISNEVRGERGAKVAENA
jgi:hypothetical protein